MKVSKNFGGRRIMKTRPIIFNGEIYFDYLHERFERTCAVGSFESLWESIHGKGAWEENPWVWVIEFRKISKSKNHD